MTLIASFRDLLLRFRGRSRLTQRELADRLGIHRRSVQEWENGASYPSPERLEGLIRVLVEAHGLTQGQEVAEAQALWSAVLREAPRTHAPFDQTWCAQLVQGATPAEVPTDGARADSPPALTGRVAEPGAAERRQDWGEAPDTSGFVGRAEELARLRGWVLDDGCRVVAILGMGGIGKTSLAARLAQEVAPSFARVYWRSLRDAPPPSDWLAGAIGFLSDQQVVPPAAESERVAALLHLLRERHCLLVLDLLPEGVRRVSRSSCWPNRIHTHRSFVARPSSMRPTWSIGSPSAAIRSWWSTTTRISCAWCGEPSRSPAARSTRLRRAAGAGTRV